MSKPILNIATYLFVALEVDALPELRSILRDRCNALNLKGTILLAPEGINMFLAGDATQVDAFLQFMRSMPNFASLQEKRSFSDTQPFGKMLVKLKKEIISLGRPEIDPSRIPAPRLDAKTLKQWLDEGREVVMFDTRNTFEIAHGTFDNAEHIGLTNFRSFAQRVKEVDPSLKNKTVVTFCTGGIRCEKAAPLMQAEGFTDVYQLDGGILKYFEECGHAHFQGECYVFDERIALDAELDPSESSNRI